MSGTSPLIRGVFVLIVIICVAVSTMASYGGLSTSLGKYALLGACLMGLILFVSNLAISEARRKRESVMLPLLAFCLGLIPSTASNFNYFYTNYLQSDLSRTAYIASVEKFRKNIESAKKRLSDDQKLQIASSKVDEVTRFLSNLSAQIRDPGAPGYGPRAREIVDAIRKLLPNMTAVAEPQKGIDAAVAWLTIFEQLVRSNLNSAVPEEMRLTLQLRDEMDSAYKKYADRITAVQVTDSSAASVQTWIENMRRQMGEFQAQVNRALSGGSPWTPPETIDPEAGRVGDIVRTFESVFKDGGNFGVAIWSLILSLFIDMAPFLYAVLLIRADDTDRDVGGGAGVGGPRRKRGISIGDLTG